MLKSIRFSRRKRSNHSIARYLDVSWYLDRNPDVRSAKIDPVEHYIRFGWREGRSPNLFFDVTFYLKQNADVADESIEPLQHYIKFGWKEGRNPHPLFDPKWYLQTYPDVAAAQLEPLLHFITHGAKENRRPHPLFDSQWYLSQNEQVRELGVPAFAHYLNRGRFEGLQPHPLFDSGWYATTYSTSTKIEDALFDYLSVGAALGRDPNPLFSSNWYLQQHELLRESSINPLVDYILRGHDEGRDPHPKFDGDWYLSNYQDVSAKGENPLQHYLSLGQFENRQTAMPSKESDVCEVLDIPYEIRRIPPCFTQKDVCLFVTYTKSGKIHDHVLRYLRTLRSSGLLVVAIISTDGLDHALPHEIKDCDGLIVRQNHGWDFGAWAAALASMPAIWQARSVFFTNDSVYGPFSQRKLQAIIESFLASRNDVLALTDSYEIKRHLMSYFIGLKEDALKSPAVQNFWKRVKSLRSKEEVITQYEVENGNDLIYSGLRVAVQFPTTIENHSQNPTLFNWRGLLKRGFPFVKVQALRDEIPGVDISDWHRALKAYPDAVNEIERHLSHLRHPDPQSDDRPIPAPPRRFRYPKTLVNGIGAVNAVRISEDTDFVMQVPFGFNISRMQLPEKVAVIAHIFYVDVADAILQQLSLIPVPSYIFISTDSDEKRTQLEHVLSRYSLPRYEVRVFPNVGRDIAPFLVGFRDVLLEYDYVLHVHSKKSPYGSSHQGWREYLLQNLVGSIEVIESILYLLKNTDTGLVFSDHFPGIRNLLNWGHDFGLAQSLLARVNISIDAGLALDFPSGSFFWARTDALRPLLDLDLSWQDFPCETGQSDGTIAHAIERSIVYVCEAQKYRWTKVSTLRSASISRLINSGSSSEVSESLERTGLRLLGNTIMSSSHFQRNAETISAMAKIDTSNRPRINLVVPTVRPEETYGGVTTALRIFEQIVDNLPEDFDVRIIVTHSAVDLHCSLGFPGYCVINPASMQDNFRRVIVNVNDVRSSKVLSLRKNDLFMTTAWWTDQYARQIVSKQNSFFGSNLPRIYLIQDFEVGFHAWSTEYALTASTYSDFSQVIPIINSEELAEFFLTKFKLKHGYVVRYFMNETLRSAIQSKERERILLLYGRPSALRNCFDLACMALAVWQKRNPERAAMWDIVSAGENYSGARLSPLSNAKVVGKLPLDQYADILSRASIGISLMLSPHPSYPPFEMAATGLVTITNNYENKRMQLRHENIIAVEILDVEHLVEAIEIAVDRAEGMLGKKAEIKDIDTLPCELPEFNPKHLASHLVELTKMK